MICLNVIGDSKFDGKESRLHGLRAADQLNVLLGCSRKIDADHPCYPEGKHGIVRPSIQEAVNKVTADRSVNAYGDDRTRALNASSQRRLWRAGLPHDITKSHSITSPSESIAYAIRQSGPSKDKMYSSDL